MSRCFFQLFLVVGVAWAAGPGATPALAGGCCAASASEPAAPGAAEVLAGRSEAPLAAWMFTPPAAADLPQRPAGRQQFEYRVERHFWLMGGVRVLPTGQPLTPATSRAEREAYSLAGLGLSYSVSPAVRATTNWATGLGPNTVAPGSQFTLGVSLRR